jgi:hypothetical protein
MTGEQLYNKQKLFSIYVHRGPGAAASEPGSIFHGRDIANRCALCRRSGENWQFAVINN